MKQFIFGVFVGGGIAGLTSYFIYKKKLNEAKREIRTECEDTICKMREYYIEKYTVQKAAVIEEDKKAEPEEIVKGYETAEYKEKVEPYHRNIDPAEMESPSEDAPEEYYEERSGIGHDDIKGIREGILANNYADDRRNTPPELISADEFGQAPGYDAEEWTYYVDDLTYCDEDDYMVDNPYMNFGNCLDDWERNNEMTEEIYVRNHQLACDYKVDKMFCQCPRFSRIDGDGMHDD